MKKVKIPAKHRKKKEKKENFRIHLMKLRKILIYQMEKGKTLMTRINPLIN